MCFKFYKEMLLIRRFEERAGSCMVWGLLVDFAILYIGQEAVVVGVHHVLEAKIVLLQRIVITDIC